MKKSIAIFGAGGFGREVLQLIRDINKLNPSKQIWNPVGFLVDESYAGKNVQGLPTISYESWLNENPETEITIAIGSSAHRQRITEKIKKSHPNSFAKLIHPRAWIGENVSIGNGSIVCAGCLITTDIKIGEHVHINIGCTIGHDASLENFSTLNPSVNVSGNVQVGTGSEIGTGSILIPNKKIGNWSIIGAGSVVTKSIPDNVTSVGSPARIIKEREHNWQQNLV